MRSTPTIDTENNRLNDDDTPLVTFEYDLKNNIIQQMKLYDDTYLSPEDPFYDDTLEALTLLRSTTTDTGKKRDFVSINASELENFTDPASGHVLTNKGEIPLSEYDPQDSEVFIIKADGHITEEVTKEDLKKLAAMGIEISFDTPDLAKQFLDGSVAEIKGDLRLDNLTTAEGLTLPQSIGGDLYLDNLTTAEGLTLPQSIGGGLYLESLTTAEGLTLPQSIGGHLYLSSLTTAEGLTLPQSIGGHLYLSSLTTAEGLTLPQSIGGDLYLRSLTTADKEMLRQKYPQHAEKIK